MPMDPEVPENKSTIIMAFVNQAAPEIRKKLQKIDRLADKSIPELLAIAKKVYNNRETPEDKQARTQEKYTRVWPKFC